MKEAVSVLGAGAGLVIALATLAGLAVRYVLFPWLKEHLADPATDIRDDIRAMARAYDGHLEWSQNEVDRIWKAIDALTETVTKLMGGKP